LAIVLNNGDLLEGDATTASKVTYVVGGLDGDAPIRLASGQLPNSKGTLYTAAGVDTITSISIFNTNTTAEAVNLYVQDGTASRQILGIDALGAGYHALFDGNKLYVYDANGKQVITDGTDNYVNIVFIIDGSGVAITTGEKGHLVIPFACTLQNWTLAADVAGAIVIDVWKDTYANFPPTNADAIPGGGKEPTIAATNQKAQDLDITDWTAIAISAGDILAFNVDSCTTITRVSLAMRALKL